MPRLLMPVKNGSVLWELTHWNHIWRLLCSVSRKQLLITTSSQICYVRNTKETIVWSWRSCMTAAPEASSTASRSYCRSVCIHRWFRPISSFTSIIRMCWPNVACCMVDVCGNCKCKVSPPLISTALKLLHLPSSFTAIERVFSNFGLVQSKLEISLAWKRQQNLWHATDSCVEMLNWTGLEFYVSYD